jgi:hypothetical protein
MRRVAGPATYEEDGPHVLMISAGELDMKRIRTIADVSPRRNATLWVPDRSNFPAIDGVLLQKDAATSFYLQCTAMNGHRKDN